MLKPLPKSGSVVSKSRVLDIMDKGKGAIVLAEVTISDEEGEPICVNQSSIYLGGAGGFGGKRNSDKVKPLAKYPPRSPDASIQEKTTLSQAALYRLSGDYNPLHVDPNFSQMGGKNLCFYSPELDPVFSIILLNCSIKKICICLFMLV